MIFGYFLTITRVPMTFADIIANLAINKYIILFIILLLFLALGCFMDTLAIIMLVVPIVYPAITALGFDPIWFGVMVVLMSCIGLITPPLGLNVYVVQGMAKDIQLSEIFKGVAPFFVANVLVVVLLTIFPDIALILPRLMLGS
jgi:C4-dicarboxylate transporter, DctM subunit